MNVTKSTSKIVNTLRCHQTQQCLHFSSVPTGTNSGMDLQHSDMTPDKNPALSLIDKLISRIPSPTKETTLSPVQVFASASVKQVSIVFYLKVIRES
jgi:hypothetical protein